MCGAPSGDSSCLGCGLVPCQVQVVLTGCRIYFFPPMVCLPEGSIIHPQMETSLFLLHVLCTTHLLPLESPHPVLGFGPMTVLAYTWADFLASWGDTPLSSRLYPASVAILPWDTFGLPSCCVLDVSLGTQCPPRAHE